MVRIEFWYEIDHSKYLMINVPIQVRLILDLGRKHAQIKFRGSNSKFRFIILENNLKSSCHQPASGVRPNTPPVTRLIRLYSLVATLPKLLQIIS